MQALKSTLKIKDSIRSGFGTTIVLKFSYQLPYQTFGMVNLVYRIWHALAMALFVPIWYWANVFGPEMFFASFYYYFFKDEI